MGGGVREAAVAGTFYPADPIELAAMVDGFLGDAPTGEGSPGTLMPRALIVPHAGYIYSGQIAATGYRQLMGGDQRHIRRILLLGPNHRVPLAQMAVSTVRAFSTPLGPVELDVEAIEQLAQLPELVMDDRPHEQEHCLEVQLPFLQRLLNDFRIIPVVVGCGNHHAVARLIRQFWHEPDTLVIVSSDLSHYHPCEESRRLDRQTSARILTLSSDLGGEEACGCYGLNGLLQVAREENCRIACFALANSADTAGSQESVVGYGTYAIY